MGGFDDVAVQSSEDCPRLPFRLKQLVDSAHGYLTTRTVPRHMAVVPVPFCDEAIRELFSISLLARRHGISFGTRWNPLRHPRKRAHFHRKTSRFVCGLCRREPRKKAHIGRESDRGPPAKPPSGENDPHSDRQLHKPPF